ncbi:MAG TPA: cysteine desulfurase family protein [Candidatus Polarisedimenticolaceae bacterium]|nr:cysteine desulfurase family protein [Candidatus Polarisedimenticolaceae bacterium]
MKTFGYLDYAAATPVDPLVTETVEAYNRDHFANPSSPHTPGRRARAALEAARALVGKTLGAKPAEIIFTSGSTEGAQIAIGGVLGAFPGGEVVVTAIEHQAVLQAAAAFSEKAPVIIPCDSTGVTQVASVSERLTDATVLVCIQYANNEIGTLQPVAQTAAEVGRIRKQRLSRGIALPLYLYCDAAQAGLLSLQVSRLGVDLLSMGGSKLYGPPGSGFLYIRTGSSLKPIFVGGGQERGLRGGTEQVGAAAGLSAALELIQRSRAGEAQRLKGLRDELWRTIHERIEGVTVNGTLAHRLPHNLHLSFAGCEGEALVAHLDASGFAVATGSACTAANQDPSHVLLAIGRTPEEAESSLRISLGRFTTDDELQRFIPTLIQAVERVRQHAQKRTSGTIGS